MVVNNQIFFSINYAWRRRILITYCTELWITVILYFHPRSESESLTARFLSLLQTDQVITACADNDACNDVTSSAARLRTKMCSTPQLCWRLIRCNTGILQLPTCGLLPCFCGQARVSRARGVALSGHASTFSRGAARSRLASSRDRSYCGCTPTTSRLARDCSRRCAVAVPVPAALRRRRGVGTPLMLSRVSCVSVSATDDAMMTQCAEKFNSTLLRG